MIKQDNKKDISLKIISTDNKTKLNRHSESEIDHLQNMIHSDCTQLKDIQFQVSSKDKTGVIGPLGLMGFGLTTFLLNLSNSNVFPMSPVVLAMGLAYGGTAQFIAGIFEWIKGNNFTSVAFMSYGAFWWSFVAIYAIPHFGWVPRADSMSVGCYLFIWLIFTSAMLVASFTKPWAVRLIFLTLEALLILLVGGTWGNSPQTLKAGGVVGIICSFCAIYTAAAEIVNIAWGITILPLGAPGELWLKKSE